MGKRLRFFFTMFSTSGHNENQITPMKKLQELQNNSQRPFSRAFGVGNSSFACPMNFEALPKLWPPHMINTKEVPPSYVVLQQRMTINGYYTYYSNQWMLLFGFTE
jgi:hypothetical protein